MAADPTRGGAQRARWVAATQASTASAATTVPGPTGSPSSSADQPSVRTGWASCTWPTRATPPRARPAYQAKKPRNIEIAETYAKPNQAVRPAWAGSDATAAAAATTPVTGADATSAQQIVRGPPRSRDSAPPSA